MFDPTSTITASGWMLQDVQKNTSKTRAQALTSKGNEHKHAYWGERTSETANFTLGGTYSGNVTEPGLGSGITDYTITYDEKEFMKLAVTKDSAAGGGTFKMSDFGIQLPARTLGIPSSITNIYTAVSNCKTVAIAVSCQHVEETDGNGAFDPSKYSGMRDATVTVTFTGISGKPTVTAATGWDVDSDTETNSNTAIGGGTVVLVKHFPFGTDTDAENKKTTET